MSVSRIVIIGGSACGPKAAARARRCAPRARITMLESSPLISYAGCGLPYYISGTIKNRGALLLRTTQQFKDIYDVDVLINTRCDAVNRQDHTIEATDVLTRQVINLKYDKLVLATRASPVMPPVEGKDLAGVHVLKDVPDADSILSLVKSEKGRNAVIIGAGLIGLEMAEALCSRGFNVTILEALDRPLPGILESDIATVLAKYLRSRGVALRVGERAVRFEGEAGKIARVVTGQSSLEADMVIVAIGVRPNTGLAQKAGLAVGRTGAIAVNQYLQTSDPDIYAGGDCVENNNLTTGSKVYAPLGSTANKHGRVIGTNVAGGSETFPGVTGTAILKIFDYSVGGVGLSEKQAREAGFDVVTSLVPGADHAGYYPGSHDILLRLIADRKSGRILGAQGIGRGDLAKRLDVLVTAITLGANVDALANLDLGYAPPFNNAMDPLHAAANVVRNKLSGMAQGLTPAQLKARLDNNEDFILLDVRGTEEWAKWRIEAPQVKLVPLPLLRKDASQLPRDKEIIVLCRRGARAYQAARILAGEGFTDVKFLEGSLAAWSYDVFGEEDA